MPVAMVVAGCQARRLLDDFREGPTMTITRFALALSAALAVGGFALSANPAAAATAMADCNKQWNDNKAANKTNGATYQDFLKSCLKAAAPATDAKATDAKPADTKAADKAAADKAAAEMKAKADAKAKTDTAAKPADTAKAKTAAVATDAKAADPEAAAKKDCNKQWKGLKDAGTEGTQKKKDFVAGCLAKAGIVVPAKTDAKMADDATPPEPTATAATPANATDANGKPRTPGQLAMDKRIKECGVLWQKSKGADGMVNGLKWPQYWSQCNTKLKAAGG
jgi:hypothetical protein